MSSKQRKSISGPNVVVTNTLAVRELEFPKYFMYVLISKARKT